MLTVRFSDTAADGLLKYAVIVSKHEGKWVFCKHKERDTYECPGGHREEGEKIEQTARRELYEETGALEYELTPICVYSVSKQCGGEAGPETFGMLYFANITSFGRLPAMEIEKVELFSELPVNWTYPQIQPMLLHQVEEILKARLYPERSSAADDTVLLHSISK